MSLYQDLRYGVRMLAASRGFTAAALLCLALGIGATTAIFSVVNAVVLRPLPYREPSKLVRIYTEFRDDGGGGLRFEKFWMSRPEFLTLRRETQAWETLDGYTAFGANLAGGSEPIRATIANVTGSLLSTLGVRPILGRVISTADDQPQAPAVAVLSYGLWQRAFGGDNGVVGHDMIINGQKASVIGVMPSGFEFPPGDPDPVQLWTAWQIDPAKPGPAGNHLLSVVGRLKPGMSVEQARDDMVRTVTRIGDAATPKTHVLNPQRHPVVMYPLHEEVTGGVRTAMLMLLGAVGFVLLISCVNVANLLLARAEARHREIAIRQALGAGFGRLTKQFVLEGITLSILGAVLGGILAWSGLRAITLAGAGSIPRAAEIHMDWQVLLFTLAVSMLTGVLFGLAPLAQTVASNVHEVLKSASGRSTASAASNLFRRGLVIAELALALVLLIGTGLMVRTFWKLQEVNVGMRTDHVLTLQLALPQGVYSQQERVLQFWSGLQENVARLPGVISASYVSGLAPQRQLQANDTQFENFTPVPGGPQNNIDYWQVAGPRFFETAKIALVEGRFFDERDGPEAPPVLIVNQTTARAYWPGQSAIGRRVRPGFTDPWRTVVGVIADVKNSGLDKPVGSEIYFPAAQTNNNQYGVPRSAFLMVRTAGDPGQMLPAIRREIHTLDPALPISKVRTMEDVVAAAQSRPRFLTLLLTLFSTVALGLAAVGIYGVISYSVEQRTNEFGIRLALGAQPIEVLGMVIRQGMILGGAGVMAGLVGAALLTRFLKALLFGTSALDLWTFAWMAVVLIAVTLVACWLPARRATKVDPLVALRYE